MAKQKKKRTKKYNGTDAAVTRPSITRVEAVNRTKLGQWWYDRRRIVKPILVASGVVLLIGWLIYELIRIIVNA